MKNLLNLELNIKILFIFLSLLLFSEIQSQELETVDKPTSHFNTPEDREKIYKLLELAKFYQNSDQEKTIRYANESLVLSKKINDLINVGRAHILLGDAYMVSGMFNKSAEHLEKANHIFSSVKSEKDEAKLYMYLGELYIKTDRTEESKKYYLKSLDIYKKIEDDKGVAWSMNGLVGVYSETGKIKEAKSSALEALKFAKITGDNELQINLHAKIADLSDTIEKANEHFEKAYVIALKTNNTRACSSINIRRGTFLSTRGKPNEGNKYYQEALRICEKNGYHNWIIKIYINLGINSLMVQGDYKSSLTNFHKGLELAKKIGDERTEAKMYGFIGAVNIEQGKYKKGIEFLYKGLEYYEKYNNKLELRGLYNNLGEAFYELSDFEKAEKNYQKALQLFEETKEPMGVGVASLNLGRMKVKEEMYDEAISYLKRSYSIFEKRGISREILLYYDAMAECMQSQGKKSEALGYIHKALKMDAGLKEYQKVAIELYTRSGMIYYELTEYDKAEMFFQKSLKQSIALESLKEIKNNFFWLSKCYEKLNRYEKGLEYYKKYTEIKDSIFSFDKIKQISDIEIKYDTDKKEKEILLLQKEKEYQNILFNSQKNELYRVNLEKDLEKERKERGIIQLKAVQRQNEIEQLNMENDLQIAEKEIKSNQLDIQKSQLARELLLRNIAIGGGGVALVISFFIFMYYRQRLNTQKIIARKEIEAINANIEGQEKERERIAKELHDGIAGNLAAIKLDLSRLSNIANHDLKKVIKNVEGTYSEVRTLSHDLIPPKILKSTFEQLIKSYLNNLSKTCSFSIVNDFYPISGFNQLTDKVKIELYRITQELMNNIIKHANADRVDIQFMIVDKHIKFIIEDDGVGFDLENVSKGIGLGNIQSRTKALSGNMHIDTLVNRGTVIEINIPLEEKEKIQNSQINTLDRGKSA